ncbi:hypothetical protein BP00DRAFT_435746 [Aspergillus indologenus CBS 114.80]|uniref:Protein kinase domain-containing protein n=1 Tax=Aspergillus indologenus CBS 114.80 TaxID=1450541 RepID=A0A2V5JA93_9EURO|nr:hypothetical protein BP00DRAFT_435746 [Aspergillus indologenus CBS 114.80]
MASGQLELSPSEVTFLEVLHDSEESVIYKVSVHGMDCVMKVFHERPRQEWDPPENEVSLCMREVAAYQRLKAKGLCARGVVPDFYGFMTDIDVTYWPDLFPFDRDTPPDSLLPKAILIEYVPNMKQIELKNYTKERAETLRDTLFEMNQMKILHGDIYPRNMMVCLGGQERVLWIDFDVSRTLPEDKSLTEEQQRWFDLEARLMNSFVNNMAADAVEGKLHKAWPCYYDATYTFWKRSMTSTICSSARLFFLE